MHGIACQCLENIFGDIWHMVVKWQWTIALMGTEHVNYTVKHERHL